MTDDATHPGTLTGSQVAPVGRRERSKADKLARIFDAGAELFEVRGFAAVTTQEIANRADIGAGTLFQYVTSKAELLVMVYNQRFAQAVADGWEAQQRERGLRPRLLAQLRPVVECNREHVENGRAYLHETVFGDPGDRYRAEALVITADLCRRIALILIDSGAVAGPAAEASARVVFAVVFTELSSALNADHAAEQLLADIDQLLATHFATWATDTSPPGAARKESQ